MRADQALPARATTSASKTTSATPISRSPAGGFPAHLYRAPAWCDDGARYFGPFTSSQAVYQSLELLRRLFPYRTCNREITGQDRAPLPVLPHQALPAAPASARSSSEEYRADHRPRLPVPGGQAGADRRRSATTRWAQAAEALRFRARRRAARPDRGHSPRSSSASASSPATCTTTTLSPLARDDGQACVQVFFVRGGKLIGREYFVLTGAQDEDEAR